MVKIITTEGGFLNYIPPTASTTGSEFGLVEMNNEVDNYWDDMTERRFILPFWKAKKMIKNSNIQQLAIKLTAFKDPSEVDGEWLSLNAITGETNSSSQSENNEEVIYYAFGQQLLNLFQKGFEDIKPLPPVDDRIINVRIGKRTKQAGDDELIEYGIFFILGEAKIHEGGPQAAHSASCGVRIPPGR